MKPMWWALLIAGSCLRARQQSAAFLARELSGITPVSVAVSRSGAGGPCFGPSCCVHVSRRFDGRCSVVTACEEDDAPMLKHLEIAVVCQEAEESYTHHSFGYGAVRPVGNVTTHLQCAVACLAPAKSNFAFTRTFRHLKLRRSSENQSASEELDLGSETSDAAEHQADIPQEQKDASAAVSEYLPEHCPPADGHFALGASPCCKRPAGLLEVLLKDVCSTPDEAVPDVCSASCFLALQLVLSSPTEDSDDDFCRAYLPVEQSLASLLNAVCTRSDGQTCASVLSESAVTAWPSVLAGWGDHSSDSANATAAPNGSAAAANATTNETGLLQRPAQPAAARRPALQQVRSASGGAASLFLRSLLASDQGAAVTRVAAAVIGLARESPGDVDASLKAICTPCYDKAVGAGLAVLNAVARAEAVFSSSLAEALANAVWDALPLPAGWNKKVNGTDLSAVRDVASSIFTGVCARDEDGGFCLPKVTAQSGGTDGPAPASRGKQQCSTRCGKVGAQIALWDGDSPHPMEEKPSQLAKAVALIDSGCAMRDESYCIDEFWAFVGQETDIEKTVENWTSSCATAASGGSCGKCADVLKKLDHFGCCKGPILENLLLLATRHEKLEEWGFVEEGTAARLDAAAEHAAIRDGVERWTGACDRPEWADVCKTCTKQVALSMDMPEGVKVDELQKHQFRIEEALLNDVALNIREPRGNLKVLDFAPRGDTSDNISVVIGVRGENCPLAASATKAFRKRLDDGDVVFAHLPETVDAIADPVKEVVSFELLYNGTDFNSTDAVVALRQKVAANMAISVADVDIPPPGKAGADGTRVVGTARADRAAAQKLAKSLEDGQPLKTADLVKSDVEVSILPNDPTVRVENRTVNEAFGPDRCVHITQADSGECILTTRNCNLDKLKHFDMAFVCGMPTGKHEKHSYGRGGGLGAIAFEPSESYNTEITCVKCLVPDPESPTAAPASGAGAAVAALLLFLSLD